MTSSPISILRVALSVLTDRVLTAVALVMTFGLYCWAAWGPEVERISVAIGFSVLVFLPCLLKERKHDRNQGKQVDSTDDAA
jgi:hypothetical protein